MTKDSARTVITIDGLAASGKSTLAKLLAKELGYSHVNTGLLYRASAFLALSKGVSEQDSEALVHLLGRHTLAFEYSIEKGSRLKIDGKDLNDQLQSQDVASFTSKIAAIPELRAALRELQLQAFPGQPIVAEGRDLGTVIFPDATAKFFIIGDPKIRAQRRALELKGKLSPEEFEITTQTVAKDLEERDERDKSRAYAPLKQADDAFLIDNTKGELVDTVQGMVQSVRQKILLK